MSPATTVSRPKATAETTRNRCRGRTLRRVDRSAPVSDPTANAVDSRPNASAPRWNTSRAIRAIVTVEDRGVEADRVGQEPRSHHLRDERLPYRRVDGRD